MNLSPYVRFARDDRVAFAWHMKERVIFDYELLYIMEGKLKVTIKDIVYNAVPGDIFLFRPGCPHSLWCKSKDGFRQPHIHFDLVRQDDSENVFISYKPYEEMTEQERKMIRQDILVSEGVHLPDKLHVNDINVFRQMLFNVIYEFENKMSFSELSAQGAFLQLWAFILQQHMFQNSSETLPYEILMQDIRRYLNVHTDIRVSLDGLSQQYNISKFHLSHVFQKMFGMSPIQYHQHCRLEKAKDMVLHTPHSMTTIAEEFGFSNLNDFSRAFKKKYNVAPTELRRGIMNIDFKNPAP